MTLLRITPLVALVAACTARPIPLAFDVEVVSDEVFMTPDQRAAAGFDFFPDGAGAVLRDDAGYTLYLPDGGAADDPQQGTHRLTSPDLSTFESLVPSPDGPVLRSGTVDPGPDDFDRDYAGGGSVVRLPAALFYFYYGEYHWDPDQWMPFYGSNGLAVSTDDGLTWTKHGELVRARLSRDLHEVTGGVLSAVVRDEFVDLYYVDQDPDAAIQRASVAVARVALSDLEVGGDVRAQKFYDGSFTEPGLSGRFSPIAQDAGALQSQGAVNVRHDDALDLDVMVHVVYGDDGGWTLAMRSSSDGLTWSAPVALGDGTPDNRLGYPMLVGLGDDPSVLGDTFDLYYVDRFGDWDQARWRRMEIRAR